MRKGRTRNIRAIDLGYTTAIAVSPSMGVRLLNSFTLILGRLTKMLVKMLYFFGWATAIVLTILEGIGVISIGWFLATIGFWIPAAVHIFLLILYVVSGLISGRLFK